MKNILILVLLFAGSVVYADCKHEGETYPDGTVLGPMECTDGVWAPRE